MPKITLPRLHEAQQTVAREARRFGVVCCGRRWGKTTFGLNIAIQEALKGKPVGWVGPTYKVVAEAFREAEKILDGIADINKNERYIRLGAGSIEFWSCESGNPGRSRKFSLLIVDEASIIVGLRAIWTNSLRATLSDLRGRAFFLSTPAGLGFFHELFMRGQDADQPTWKSWQMPTSTNPHISPKEIEDVRAELPELSFHQEYLAEFVSFEGAVFRYLDRAVFDPPEDLKTPQLVQPFHTFRRSYCIGVDWGGITDRTAIAVATDEPFAPTGGSVAFCDESANLRAEWSTQTSICEIDYFRDRDFSVQRARLFAIWRRYGCPPVLAEENSIGRPTIEQLRAEGMPVRGFVTTNSSKARIVQDVVLDLERGNIRLPRDPILTGEMQGFEASRTESGMTKYSAPSGQHDDCVIATCLARHGLVKYGWACNPYEMKRKNDIAMMIGGGSGLW